MKKICLIMFFILLISGNCKYFHYEKTAFKNCRIVLENKIIENGLIVIDKNRIFYAGENRTDYQLKDCRIIDAKGLTALPALINSHVHDICNEKKLIKFMEGGVGSVCDFSARDFDKNMTDKKVFNDNNAGSRLFCSTPMITVSGGYGYIKADSPDQARMIVREYIKKNADLIKISIEDDCEGKTWKKMNPEITSAIADEAHKADKKVAAHITHTRNIPQAVECGVDIIAHSTVEPLSDEIIQKLKERNIIFTPTLELWKIVSEEYRTNYLAVAVENLKKLNAAGVEIALGTDYSGHPGIFDEGYPQTEIELMKEAEMNNIEIIKSATQTAAKVLGSKELGILKEGFLADILFAEGAPDKNIDDLKKIKYLLINGEIMIER